MFFFHKGDPSLSHPAVPRGAFMMHPPTNGSGQQCWDRRGAAEPSGSGSDSGCGLTPWASEKSHEESLPVPLSLAAVSAPLRTGTASQKPCVDPDFLVQQSLKPGPPATRLKSLPLSSPPRTLTPRPNQMGPLSLNNHSLPTCQPGPLLFLFLERLILSPPSFKTPSPPPPGSPPFLTTSARPLP